MRPKYLYFFGAGQTDGKSTLRDLLGGKGANLAEMANIGINVPPGFTISTAACNHFFDNRLTFPPGLWDDVLEYLGKLETVMEACFGDSRRPLLVSVRSGARVSMPGMMDTILNLGLNDETVSGLAEITGNECFALDCYRRFIAMFGNVVLGINGSKFETLLDRQKKSRKLASDTELTPKDLKILISKFKVLVKKGSGRAFPEDPLKQLRMAVEAVFRSWNTDRAVVYRKLNCIPSEWGTAVNVQSMVFGNMGSDSGTGVAFTRNPATGEKVLYGEFLINAQGEDVVAGVRTPEPIAHLEKVMPDVFKDLTEIYQKLENHYQDMQDIEFTVQGGQLYLLQTRSGKRAPAAAIKVAADMVKEGLISKQTAVMRVPADNLDQIFHPMVDPDEKMDSLAKGLGASPGAASGKIVFTPERAEELAAKKERVILVRMETSPEDIHGMSVAQGILTSKGGMTSHAAVVARAMGKPCVSGYGGLTIDEKRKKCQLGKVELKELDTLTLDGSTGKVMRGTVKLIPPRLGLTFNQIMKWCDEARMLRVRANADTPHDALVARDFGAEGIGLCRTEHMFFNEGRILQVRAMILAENSKEREDALKKLLPIQRGDFTQIFKVMEGLPVTIRLLDPPLHEFLPSKLEDLKTVARELGFSANKLKNKINSLHEINPMLGHRGCRLGITFPEIYRMQVKAIVEAACKLVKKGMKVFPEIMVPLVGHVNELRFARELIEETAEDVLEKADVKLNYKIGTMIELPRAALTAEEIAREADFFSFGTNDLTQTAFGLSRDDVASFMPEYLSRGILEKDPFVTLDEGGAGGLIKIAVEKGKGTNENLHLGICGEHGGDPNSIGFCHKVGLDYVSCSPFRVPTARLAAAQAAISEFV